VLCWRSILDETWAHYRSLIQHWGVQYYSYFVYYRQNSEPLASFSGLFRSEYKWILYLTTMYVYCVYPAMSNELENLLDLNKKDRNKCHSSPFINVVKCVFFVVRVTLIPVSYLSASYAVHSYKVPGKFICRLKSLKFHCSLNLFIQDICGNILLLVKY
jgi:hypothetical protein